MDGVLSNSDCKILYSHIYVNKLSKFYSDLEKISSSENVDSEEVLFTASFRQYISAARHIFVFFDNKTGYSYALFVAIYCFFLAFSWRKFHTTS